MPVEGAPTESEAQGTLSVLLQSGQSGNANGPTALTDGYSGPRLLELVNSGSGNIAFTPQGSFDGMTWYLIGMQRVAGAVPVAAGVSFVYQLFDAYPYTLCVTNSAVAGASLNARLYAVPQ